MRRKFFFISFSVLLITTLSITAILLYYFRSERLTFLDAQIRQTATAIIDSKIYNFSPRDFRHAEDIISEELGPESVGKFFIIRNEQNQILFQTQNINLLPDEIPQSPQWVTLTTKNYLIRAVNLELPRISGRTMQVGIIVDSSFMSIANVNKRTVLMISLLFVLILLLTWVLSAYLFSPIRSLTAYVNEINGSFEKDAELPALPSVFNKLRPKNSFTHSDEFQNLLQVLDSMVEKINTNRKILRSWTFQMAHELKTPLTIINRDFEILTQKYRLAPEDSAGVQHTIQKISDLISSFLGWAEITSIRKLENLYVIHLSEVVLPLAQNWGKVCDENRLELKCQNDFQLLCNPLHLEQVINNILGNAFKYSTGKIEISYQNHELLIKDEGPGIPPEVLKRLGSPFNKGVGVETKKGVGLGLAWVKTICELYSWECQFSQDSGTRVRLKFNPVVPE